MTDFPGTVWLNILKCYTRVENCLGRGADGNILLAALKARAARWERLARTPGQLKWDEDSMEAVVPAGIIQGNGEERAAPV